MTSSSSPQHLHIAVFPFMSKGHTIPLLHLTKLIHNHRPQATFTVFTTLANQPLISASLSSLPPSTVTIVSLPFPATNNDIPPGVESTDQLPSMSLFYSFTCTVKNLQPQFETALENLQKGDHPISLLISDWFLYWTQQSASKFNILRLDFDGMNMYASVVSRIMAEHRPFSRLDAEDESIQLPNFPRIRVRKDDFETAFYIDDPEDPKFKFVMECVTCRIKSNGIVVNSFYELERPFIDYNNAKPGPKSWCVGPLCLATEPNLERRPTWIEWLDEKWSEGKPVLYVAFGTQAEISNEQLKEITMGLEKSEAYILWVSRIKPKQEVVMEGFEDSMKGRGLVVREWVEQREVLEHESVQGFLSHCGWNSTIESICAGVPILAWPMMAEQHLNAKFVAEEIEVGLRVETVDGSPRGFVKWEGLSKMVKELMEGETGKRVRKKVKEFSQIAKTSVEEGGSSWCNVETLLNNFDLCTN